MTRAGRPIAGMPPIGARRGNEAVGWTSQNAPAARPFLAPSPRHPLTLSRKYGASSLCRAIGREPRSEFRTGESGRAGQALLFGGRSGTEKRHHTSRATRRVPCKRQPSSTPRN